ncbi:MAG: NTP transferase domain-containing protein [Candidatus Omnitrophica bacterium]|nr:NTP transferase domain-containing protein [Candidatus Omnitrophota bacterium]
MKKVGVFSFGRIQSQRCPNKMLRPFADTTLTDVILEKLSQCGADAFFAGNGQEFRDKCARYAVPYLSRTSRSAEIDGPIVEILSFLRQVDFEHLLIVNGCLPFLKLGTIQHFLKECLANDCQSSFGVIRRQTHFLRLSREAVNFNPEDPTINTKTVEPILEFAHALYFFNREYFLAHGAYWNWKTVRLIELDSGLELFDIDTEEQFKLAEALWKVGLR